MIQPTVTADEASQRRWDAIVIGAGPSGATAAREAALRGASVLLVDRAAFPRQKICGCCLNLRVIDALRRMRLGHLLKENGAVTLHDVKIAAGGRSATLPLPDCAALSRGRFDAALIRAAIDAGVAFLPRTNAVTECVRDGVRTVSLGAADQRVSAAAKVVIAAGGLGSDSSVRNAGIVTRVARRSRIGAAVILDDAPAAYAAGTTYMSSAPGGYVGLVRLEDGRLDVAAAFDASYVKRSGGLGRAAAEVIRRAGLPELDGLAEQRWHGTATLTRRPSQVACERLLLVGDAAGYVEPFTGEGIAGA
ncbi:MAG: NAD(P)/FAD-dependent oxidoreductase, partial [Planctomycetes bacterium]|nr:NAD(P)/FAD-dependent oxidoreductase [Planctomycetota bacterium]